MLASVLPADQPRMPLGRRLRAGLSALGLAGVALVGAMDFWTGYQINLSFFYLAPIAFCTWAGDRQIGLLVAFAAGTMAMLADVLIDKGTSHEVFSYWNAVNRLSFFLLVVFMIARIRTLYTRQADLVRELNAALADIRRLSGLLPICSWCKKIRDDKGYWKQVESYLSEHSEAEFTHGICPECEAGFRGMMGAKE